MSDHRKRDLSGDEPIPDKILDALIVAALEYDADQPLKDDYSSGDQNGEFRGQVTDKTLSKAPKTQIARMSTSATRSPRSMHRGTVMVGCFAFMLGAGSLAGYNKFTDRSELDNFEEVVTQSAALLNRTDGELYIAVDVPAYGDGSCPRQFPAYRAAIANRMASEAAESTHILWYSDEDEQKYIDKESQSTDPALLRNSRAIRQAVADVADVTEVPFGRLHDFQFWVWRGDDGECEVVLARVEKSSLKAEVRGVHSTSPEFADVLILLFDSLRDRARGSSSSQVEE